MKTILTLILISICSFCQFISAQVNQKNRVIILTDIEADPDDTQSMVRLLFYSNVIDIKGLIATTSVWQKTRVVPESIIKVIQAYGKVQPNLNKHEAGFPEAEELLMKVDEVRFRRTSIQIQYANLMNSQKEEVSNVAASTNTPAED